MSKTLLICLLSLTVLASCSESKTEQVKPHTPISPDKAVIYELFIRNFTEAGTINAITPRLSELKELGINTIWLMPIHPVGELNRKGTYGSPYSIKDFYSINPEFGNKEDFRKLIDSVHSRGMNLIIDFVGNHTSWDNAWVKNHPDWYTHDSTGKIIPPVADWTDVADLNYDNKDLRAEMMKVMKYWVDSFDIDGYRCDVAEMVPLDFWKNAIGELNKIKPVLMLAEGADPKLIDNGFQITYGWELYHNLKKIWKGEKPVLVIDTVMNAEKKYRADSRRLRLTTNHDETSWDNSPVILFKGLKGSMAAYVASVMIPGVPLAYNGQEVGSDVKANLFEKTAIAWNSNPEVKEFYTKILALYNSKEVLRNGKLEMLPPAGKGVITYCRVLEKDKIFILVNSMSEPSKITLPQGTTTEKLNVLFTDKDGNSIPDTLDGYSYYLLQVKD